MRTVARVLSDAARRLAPLGDTPRLDAELLLAHALGIPRVKLLAMGRQAIDETRFSPLLERRLASEPVAYILGRRAFFAHDFMVRPPILVPRPETEHLVELALEHIADRPLSVLDLCTGSGCIAVSIAAHEAQCTVMATDINPEAITLARENNAALGTGVFFYRGDLFGALPSRDSRFDIIVGNPPYVESGDWETLPPDIRNYEDPAALIAGVDGLDLIRRIVSDAPAWLNPGGLLAMEIGERQFDDTAQLFDGAGFREIACKKDLAGVRRIIHGTTPRSRTGQAG